MSGGGRIDPGAVLRAVGDLVYEVTPAGVCVGWLGQRDDLPVAPERLVGRSLADTVAGGGGPQLLAAAALVLADGAPRSVAYTVLRDASPPRPREARIAPAGNGNVFIVVRSVDAHLEQETRESESRFRAMADHAPVMLWLAGLDSECWFFNRGWLEFTGRPIEDEVGVGWAEGIHFEDFQSAMRIYLESFVARRAFRMEYRLRRHDGAYRWILDTGLPRYEASGGFAGFVGSCIDITEIREAQDTQRGLNAELGQRLRERDVLLREIHHRVKNNLQLVSSLLRMQGRQASAASTRAALDDCQQRVHAMSLVHEWLYQADELVGPAFSEYARAVVASVFQAGAHAARGVALEVDIDEVGLGLDQAIPCGLVLNELVTNALKHGFPDGRAGRIRVSIRAGAGGRIGLAVEDDGVGLPPHVDVWNGDTLGLQLVTSLASQLGATLVVDATAGTAVRLEFTDER